MEHLGTLAGIAGVFLLACLSPGPVWVVITSTAAAVSRRAGVLAGLGVAGATLSWATIAMLGFGLLTRLAWLTIAIRLAGAAYLVWLGCRTMAAARRPSTAVPGQQGARGNRGNAAALRRGYMASITNPKAAAFFGSIYVVMLPAHAPGWVYVATILLLAAVSAAWHCGLALVFSAAPVQAAYRRAKNRIDAATGAILVLLGIRLAASR